MNPIDRAKDCFLRAAALLTQTPTYETLSESFTELAAGVGWLAKDIRGVRIATDFGRMLAQQQMRVNVQHAADVRDVREDLERERERVKREQVAEEVAETTLIHEGEDPRAEIAVLFHALWTRSCGTIHYDKAKWKRLQLLLWEECKVKV